MPDLAGFNFSFVNLMGGIVWSGVGFVAFMYGKKMSAWKPMVIGVLLMAYPYFISDTWLLYGIGAALSASLYFLRD